MNDLLQMTQVESAAPSAISTFPANATSAMDGDISSSISQMLTANENRPGFMYQDVSSVLEPAVPERPVAQYTPPAPAPQPVRQEYTHYQPPAQDPTLMNALQYERSRNEQLAQKAQYLQAIEEFLANDPVSANRAIQYLNTGALDMPVQQQPVANHNDPVYRYDQQSQQAQQPQVQRQQISTVPPVLRKKMDELEEEVAYMRLKNEAAELERQYPGVFQTAPVAQYMLDNNFTSMKDAFHHLLGNSVGEIMRAQQMQNYQQQMAAWQAYQQQYSQQYQQPQYQQQYQQAYQQPQYADTAYQTQYPATSTTPPPAASDMAVVMRPGAGLMASDPLDNVKPKNWEEAKALMLHDMKRAGFAV